LSDRPAAEYDDDAFDGPRWMSDRFAPAAGAAPRAPMVSESIVSRRPAINGSTECPSECVPCVGEPGPGLGCPPGLLLLSDIPVNPPDRVVDAFRLDGFVVFPQPR
jgi:hypothetical protein